MQSKTTYREVLKWASSFLETCKRESTAAEILLKERLNWTKTDIMMHLNEEMPSDVKHQLLQDVSNHGSGMPVQQILGYGWFYERKFKVTKDTLIPRPETEEIVDNFLKGTSPDQKLTVLDIGTGSGIIGITIKKERPLFEVTATDLSSRALGVAQENAAILQAEVRFLAGDLTQPVKGKTFDVIISNPPYISDDEISYMDESVLHYEPHLALFADNGGLAIYQRLAEETPAILNPGGEIFLEIGFKQGKKVQEIFQQAFPKAEVTIEKDMSGNDRLIRVKTS
ncbi:peptide chain release factor N(5)-glutamine methyltransferase [Carnobacterium sp. ISL-102]|uniref:peptide chain release factor N(5)-glutamine methyltransferase n=1 Tax=Carnobacterium sp. ISL-102 TaxID=2819142 RepID=UPI001BEAB7AD|nr:peptide chain release factor N(5)-glutamine methyltransferase [Carnobacterium sp. ISL-102]MBT2732496.1 peptide chain release factor N(5)-glutamine methyltransferase [Carnobacterium sp. ISL-102]